jgi:hypothetical protein
LSIEKLELFKNKKLTVFVEVAFKELIKELGVEKVISHSNTSKKQIGNISYTSMT